MTNCFRRSPEALGKWTTDYDGMNDGDKPTDDDKIDANPNVKKIEKMWLLLVASYYSSIVEHCFNKNKSFVWTKKK